MFVEEEEKVPQVLQNYSIEEWLQIHSAYFKQLFENQNINAIFSQDEVVIWDTEVNHVDSATPDNIREWLNQALFIY